MGHGGAIKTTFKDSSSEEEPSSKKNILLSKIRQAITFEKFLQFLGLAKWTRIFRKSSKGIDNPAGKILDIRVFLNKLKIVFNNLSSILSFRLVFLTVGSLSAGVNYLFSSKYFKHASVAVVFILILINNTFAQNTKSLNEEVSFWSDAEAKKLTSQTLVDIVKAIDYYTVIDEQPDLLPQSLKTTETIMISKDGFVAKPNVALAQEKTPAVSGSQATSEKRGNTNYKVQEGDTLGGIAVAFDVSMATIKYANNLSNIDIIQPGKELVIPASNGILHTVSAGETLLGIVKKYQGEYSKTLSENGIASADSIYIGQKILVIDGRYTPPAPKPVSNRRYSYKNNYELPSGSFAFPTSGGPYYNGYHWWAIDIPRPIGTGVYASDAGRVITAGWNSGGYGRYIVIDHGNGFRTLYAHLSSIGVGVGQYVGKRQYIAATGNSGRSTGPHLHFEIIYNGRKLNPINYVR